MTSCSGGRGGLGQSRAASSSPGATCGSGPEALVPRREASPSTPDPYPTPDPARPVCGRGPRSLAPPPRRVLFRKADPSAWTEGRTAGGGKEEARELDGVRTMKAELLATASAVSFVLFLVAVGVWARSYWHPGISVTTSLPHHNGERVGRSIFGGLSCGKIGVGRVVTRHPEPSGEGDMDRILTTHDHLWRKAHSEYVVSIGRVSGGGILGRLGFGHGVDSDGDGETSPRHQHVWVHFPLLPLVVLAGLLPSVWAKRRWWPRGAGQKVAIRTAGETGPDGRLGEGGHGWDEGAIRTSLWTVVLVCSALLTLVLSMVWATSYLPPSASSRFRSRQP